MANTWTGKLVMKMHNNRIKQKDIAEKLQTNPGYVSHIINGMPCSAEVQDRFKTAVDEIIAERKAAK